MDQHKGKELLLAAIITEAEHRVTKNGDPFGTMILEDYNDTYKLFLWRENYLKFKHFMQPNMFVAVKGKIEIPPRRNELEFVVSSIELLQNIRESKANNLNIRISSKNLTQPVIADLFKLFNEHEGRCALNFTVFDPLENIEVKLPARNLRVDPNNQLFKELEKYDLEFDLK